MITVEQRTWVETNNDGTTTKYSGFVLSDHEILIRKHGDSIVAYRRGRDHINLDFINDELKHSEISAKFAALVIELCDKQEQLQKYKQEAEIIFEQFKDTECICPKECDCQNPPPDNWDGLSGSYGVSEECPIHNDNPKFTEGCPVHDPL